MPSKKEQRLRASEERLLAERREVQSEVDSKDREIQKHYETLVESVSRRDEEVRIRERLVQELAQARAEHKRNLESQQESLERQHRQQARLHIQKLEATARRTFTEEALQFDERAAAMAASSPAATLPAGSPSFAESREAAASEAFAGGGDFEPGCVCEVVAACIVEAGEDQGSAALGELAPGAEVSILEVGGVAGGRFHRLRLQCGENKGWIDRFTATGQDALRKVVVHQPNLGTSLSQQHLGSTVLLRTTSSLGFLPQDLEEAQELVHRETLAEPEQRAARAREELEVMEAELQHLGLERDGEEEAAKVTREAAFAEQRAALRRGERLVAETRAQECETDALFDEQRCMEGRVRALQQDLSRAVHTLGQKDQEMKVKNAEFQEVRQSVGSIQDEMDEVNAKLREQCDRVQRVEGSLRLSRDLSDRLKAMRAMVNESTESTGQLCSLLETERARREQASQGLKQQRVRTELLLQLLHQFKSRTQDLTPQALLANVAQGQGAQVFSPTGGFGGMPDEMDPAGGHHGMGYGYHT